jgi:large subunit ribosomal protein L9
MNTKIILNQDLAALGEEGDVKHVARGFARNFLFPRGIAVPFNERTQKMFEARKGEIEARKAQKRQDAASLKERLEGLELKIVMSAGGNGKLYGAVTTQTVADELAKNGFSVERKKIEIPGNTIQSAGRHKLTVRLYDNAGAEVTLVVEAQEATSEKRAETGARRSRSGTAVTADGAADGVAADSAVADGTTAAGESAAANVDGVSSPAGESVAASGEGEAGGTDEAGATPLA